MRCLNAEQTGRVGEPGAGQGQPGDDKPARPRLTRLPEPTAFNGFELVSKCSRLDGPTSCFISFWVIDLGKLQILRQFLL